MYCGVETLADNGVTYYFVDNEEMFSVDAIYGDGVQEGYRFAFFCRAVAEMLRRHRLCRRTCCTSTTGRPGSSRPCCRTQYAGDQRGLAPCASSSPSTTCAIRASSTGTRMNARLGFGRAAVHTPDYLEFYGSLSCMKAGLVFADHINTVSPTYAREIRNRRTTASGSTACCARAARPLSGILNGIDRDDLRPGHRPLPRRALRSWTTWPARPTPEAPACSRSCAWPRAPDVPLIAMVSRLTPQKGLDLVERVLTDILRMDVAARAAGRRRPALRRPAQLGGLALSRAGGHAYIGLKRGAGAPRLRRQRHVPHAVAV